ncbi:hypothetical protein COLO4_03714, partial [Corchorus olitorius]
MDSSSAVPSLHLAMAALLGASLMAISAFYIHKRSVDHVIDRLVEIRRECRPRSRVFSDGDDEEGESKEVEHEQEDGEQEVEDDEEVECYKGGSLEHKSNLSKSFEEQMELLTSNRMSSSMPNVALRNEWFEEDAKFDQAVRERVQTCSASSLDKLNFIPSGLPPLQTTRR